MKKWAWTLALALTCGAAAAGTPPAQEDVAAQIVAGAGDHRLIVLGELHGTRETPLLVRALVEHYAAAGAPLQLGIELPESENAALATYLGSNGNDAARHAVRDTAYWRVADHLHDGRRSQDMLDLIDAVRALRASGRDVQVFGFDRVLPAAQAGSGARDAAMADILRERYAGLPTSGRLLVLTGNMHGMRVQPRNLHYPPLAALLADLPLYNVRIEARGGEFWGCVQHRRCGSRPLITYDGPAPRAYRSPDRDYDLMVFLPRFTVARLLGTKR